MIIPRFIVIYTEKCTPNIVIMNSAVILNMILTHFKLIEFKCQKMREQKRNQVKELKMAARLHWERDTERKLLRLNAIQLSNEISE